MHLLGVDASQRTRNAKEEVSAFKLSNIVIGKLLVLSVWPTSIDYCKCSTIPSGSRMNFKAVNYIFKIPETQVIVDKWHERNIVWRRSRSTQWRNRCWNIFRIGSYLLPKNWRHHGAVRSRQSTCRQDQWYRKWLSDSLNIEDTSDWVQALGSSGVCLKVSFNFLDWNRMLVHIPSSSIF